MQCRGCNARPASRRAGEGAGRFTEKSRQDERPPKKAPSGRCAEAGNCDQGIRESLGKIKPGETSTLTVKLEPGSYTASCPEHRGERMTFKVTEE